MRDRRNDHDDKRLISGYTTLPLAMIPPHADGILPSGGYWAKLSRDMSPGI